MFALNRRKKNDRTQLCNFSSISLMSWVEEYHCPIVVAFSYDSPSAYPTILVVLCSACSR